MENIIELVEEICDFPLTDFHKEFVVKTYDAAKNRNCLYYIQPRGSSKFSLIILQTIVMMIVAQEMGLLNKDFTDNYSVEKTFSEPFPYAVEKKE